MPSVTLTFSSPLNVSCQVGDKAYYVASASVTNTAFSINSNNVTEIGEIRQITGSTTNSPTVVCDTVLSFASVDNQTRFIFFSKDNKANLSSLLGYYADVKMVNTSKEYAELHSVSMDSFGSSK